MKQNMTPVMNNTKWDELRTAMCQLREDGLDWRTRDVESGYVSNWDSDWFHHFKGHGYESIEWVEIKITCAKQKESTLEILKKIHLPGCVTDEGFRIYGYIAKGMSVEYL